MRVPFFMRRTGIAAEYPSGVFIVEAAETAVSVALRIDRVASEKDSRAVKAVLDSGYTTVSEWARAGRRGPQAGGRRAIACGRADAA